jgi:hypothetical protein
MSNTPLGFSPRVALCVALTAAALSSFPRDAEAGGDDVYGTRGAELLVERGHSIALTMDRGYASLRVRRTVHNGIDRHEEAMFWINVPETSVATGLRTLGELHGKPRWFAGELLEAEAAAARYQELTGIGGWYPKDPALLSWRDQSLLALQVFPVAPHTEKTIEYTLSIPATWEDGRWRLQLPDLGTDTLAAEVVLSPAQPLDQLFVNGEVVASGHHLTLDDWAEIELAPRDPSPVSLELGSVSTGERYLAAWRLTLAPELSKLPSRARIVVALDLSRSLDPEEIEAQRLAALTYLEHFTDPALATEVALLGFDREVHSLSPGFVTAAQAIELLRAATLPQRNGSEVGLALAKADALLSGSKRGPRRILLMTDFETASRVTPEAYAATVEHSDAILHLAHVSADEDTLLLRDDQHPWSTLAASTQGVVWDAWVPTAWDDADARAHGLEVIEEWARPVRVDNLRVQISGLTPDDTSYWDNFDTTLDEGQGLHDLLLSPTPGRELSVEGVTWNIPLRETAKPSRETGDRWSALVFGSPLLWELSEPEMMQLALRGEAVSPVTSYLAIEPGVRPSTEGLEHETSASGGGGIGLIGRGSGGGGVHHGALPAFDKQAWLEAELREGWTRCGGRGLSAQVDLETQSVEILDVALTTASTDAPLRACMEQVTWSIALHPRFTEAQTWRVQLL